LAPAVWTSRIFFGSHFPLALGKMNAMLRVKNTFLALCFAHLEFDLCEPEEGEGRMPQKMPGRDPKFPSAPTPAKKVYRIHVKGMTQRATRDRLKEYLEMLRIYVVSIEWITDEGRNNRTRFAFVNVENSASFKRALSLGKRLEYRTENVPDLGALCIGKAKPIGAAKNNSNDESKLPSIPLPWTAAWATASQEGAVSTQKTSSLEVPPSKAHRTRCGNSQKACASKKIWARKQSHRNTGD